MNNTISKIKKLINSFLKDPLYLRKWESDYPRGRSHQDQLSVRISARTRRTAHPYYGDSGMFVDDMYTGIMPYMIYRGEREKYPVVVTPEVTHEQERMIAEGISARNHVYYIEDAICDFIRSATQALFQEGVAFYEINQTRNENGELENFELESISPYSLYSYGDYYYQFVSWGEAKEEKTRVQLIKIPKEKIIKIELPKGLVSRKKLKKILKNLYFSSKESIPSFQMKAMENQQNIGFDMTIYQKTKFLEAATLTKLFGWDQRQSFMRINYTTEYYSMVRFLRKKKIEAKLRNEIIGKINEALNSPLLNLGVTIAMQNLFSEEDVMEQEESLKSGNVKFMDIFNALKT